MKFSEPETRLLREIQRDSSLSLAELAARCGMAQSTVWRKLQEFENAGLIRGRVALLDPAKAGCKLTVMASISLQDHAEETVTAEWRARGDVDLDRLVTHVLVHELAHHFGWSDEDIAAIDRWWE